MSNKIRRTSNNKSPTVKKKEFLQWVQYFEKRLGYLHSLAVAAGGAANNLKEYLVEGGIIDGDKYQAFLDKKEEKLLLAREISKDDSLDRNGKIAKAKENDIPEGWVVQPEAEPEVSQETESEKMA